MSTFNQALKFLLLLVLSVPLAETAIGQASSIERTFPQSPERVERAIKQLGVTAGRLPVLDGFTKPDDRPVDRFQRGYYQASLKVEPASSGGSTVRIGTKITAWYSDPVSSKSGYQVLSSNGRIEADLLDRLESQLNSGPTTETSSSSRTQPQSSKPSTAPALSAPVPQLPSVNNALTGSSTSRSAGAKMPDANAAAPSSMSQSEPTDPNNAELVAEAKNLEEILHNQSHPTNLVAVKKNGAPVLASPADGAKVLFAAAAEDEFELLDMNPAWAHVRISGLSRGWIRRSNLEMPNEQQSTSSAASRDSPQPFHVTRQERAAFPGDWEPLKGKQVEIVSVQASSESAVSGWRAKRDYAKATFDQELAKYSKSEGNPLGVVLIFDAVDGGMIAATWFSLEQWKKGTLTEDDFWKQCFFDPPETFGAQPGQ